jgi:hypothetical protein
MSDHLPIFHTLLNSLSETHDEKLEEERTRFFMQHVRSLDEYGMELIYAIIRCYQIEIDKQDYPETPYYHARTKKKNTIRYDLSLFPAKLKNLLFQFMELHISTSRQRI